MAVCLLLSVAPALGASQKDHDDCNANDADRNIAGCTRLIEDRTESKRVRAIAHVGRGLAWRSKGDRDRAINDFTDAIGLDPDDALAYNNRANLWREMGEVNRAIADLSEAIRIDPQPRSDLAGPGHVNLHTNRGLAFHAKGDFERALADYDQALRLDPNDTEALVHRGSIHRMRGNYERAIADFNATIRLEPDHAHGYHLRGTTYYELYMGASAWINKEDLGRAIADFSQMIRLEPSSAVAYYLRGRAYSIAGERDRAGTDIVAAYLLDPINPGIRELLKELRPDNEPPKESLETLLKRAR